MKDISAQRFGRLIALSPSGRSNDRQVVWLCQCDCGNTSKVKSGNLRSGTTNSCGCLQTESRYIKKHAGVDTPEYGSWRSMLSRCANVKNNVFHRYGGRGIKVCDRWLEFSNFYMDMGQKPTPKHTIDRIDSNGDYCPENCRWATQKEQQNNRGDNRIIECNGISKNLSEWASESGIDASLINWRIKSGWSIREALTQKPRAYHDARTGG